MTRDDVVKNILIKIDEISPFSEPDEQFTLLIDGLLDNAANSFLRLIPLHLLRGVGKRLSTATLNAGSDSAFYVLNRLGAWDVPSSFLRMIKCTCNQWRRPVMTMLPITDSQYEKEFNRFTSSGNSKPVIYDDTIGDNRRLILAPYTDTGTHDDIELLYVEEVPVSSQAQSGSQQYGIPEEILDSFFYYASYVILTTMQKADFAQLMLNKFKESITSRQ